MDNIVLASKDAEKKLVLSRDDLMHSAENVTEITDPAHADMASDILKGLKKWISGSESKRKEIVKPFNDGVKAINKNFKELAAPVSAEVSRIDMMLKKYLVAKAKAEEEARRREREALLREAEEAAKAAAEAETKAEAEVEQQIAEATLDAAVKVDTAKSGPLKSTYGTTTSLRDNWKGEVVNLRELVQAIAEGRAPLDMIQPNDRQIGSFAKQHKEKASIAGIRFFNDPVISSR